MRRLPPPSLDHAPQDWVPAETAFICRVLSSSPSYSGGNMDWAAFLRSVHHHRLDLPMARHLSRLADVPPPILRTLREHGQIADLRSQMQVAELCHLLQAFDEQGLPAAIIKGPALSIQCHGHPNARCSADLDLMVRRQDRSACLTLLQQRGYTRTGKTLPWDDPAFETCLIRAKPRLAVDVHVQLFTDDRLFPIDRIDPFTRGKPVEILGQSIPTLAPPAAFLYAALHGCKHLWRRLGWLFDVAEAARSNRLPWDETLDLAEELGAERALILTALLARILFNAPVPERIMAHPQLGPAHQTLNGLRPILQGPLLTSDAAAIRSMGRVRYLIWENKLHHGWRRRLYALALHARPSPTDTALIALPRGLRWLYGPLRVIRVLSRRPG